MSKGINKKRQKYAEQLDEALRNNDKRSLEKLIKKAWSSDYAMLEILDRLIPDAKETE